MERIVWFSNRESVIAKCWCGCDQFHEVPLITVLEHRERFVLVITISFPFYISKN